MLACLKWEICLIYPDVIIVVRRTFEGMIENLSKVFERLLSAEIKLKAKKCFLFRKSVEYLGHVISPEGVTTDLGKKGFPEYVSTSKRRPAIIES